MLNKNNPYYMTNRNKTFCAYRKLLQKDKDWHYGYLLALERKKMQRMLVYFKEHPITEDNDRIMHYIAISISLLDIILEEDARYLSWLSEQHNDYKSSLEERPDGNYYNLEYVREPTDFPLYINVRNAARFLRRPLVQNGDDWQAKSSFISSKVCLRQTKALYLYNLIRSYHIMEWWN